MAEINVNEIAGHAAADLVEQFFSSIGTSTRDQIAKYKLRFGQGFSRYLSETLSRYSHFKTLINRHDAISMSDHYVPASIQFLDNKLRPEDFFKLILKDKRYIVEGTAGLGKTLFVRNLLRHAILNEKNHIPIIFELRNLHFDNSQSLLSNLAKQVSDYIPGFNEEHLKFGLERGKFLVFLDGIDEISLADRTRYASEILDLAYRFTETPILLSTRPDDFYLPWEVFRIAELLPMSKSQTQLMLSKIEYDEEIKNRFLKLLDDGYFYEHKDFLSVPLLSTLMMLTYSEFSKIPQNIHVFYEQAFQTLFHKHDFIKGAYSRKIESGLDVEQFRKALSAFCFVSYLEQRFSFLHFQVLEDIGSALSMTQVEATKDSFLKDLLVTICLLQRDGNYLTFIHRSFQEYFAALFISKMPPSDMCEVVNALSSRGRVDSVVKMTISLNESTMEKEWIIPKLRTFNDKISNGSDELSLISNLFGTPSFSHGLIFSTTSLVDFNIMNLILSHYSKSSQHKSDTYTDDSRIIANYIDQQKSLSDKNLRHNRAALGARKRQLQGKPFNLKALPSSIVNSLRCVKDIAHSIKQLQLLMAELEKKQNTREYSIQSLISKYKG